MNILYAHVKFARLCLTTLQAIQLRAQMHCQLNTASVCLELSSLVDRMMLVILLKCFLSDMTLIKNATI